MSDCNCNKDRSFWDGSGNVGIEFWDGSGSIDIEFDQKQEFSVSGDYDKLKNKPTLNGVTIEGDKTSEDYHINSGNASFPDDGNVDDIIVKTEDGVAWLPPATEIVDGDGRYVTSDLVFDVIGDINAILTSI